MAQDRSKLSRVCAGRGVITSQEDRAGGVDGLDPLDDLELGSIRPPRNDDIADPQAHPVIDGPGNDQGTGR